MSTANKHMCVCANSTQVFAQSLNCMGCILPSEQTNASLAAHAMVVMFGPNALILPQAQMQGVFENGKTRLKQLYRSEPAVFLARLPPTPAQLLRECPIMALNLYAGGRLPVTCRLNQDLVNSVMSRIQMRGGKKLSMPGATSITI